MTSTSATSGSSSARASAMPVIFAAHGAPVLLDDETWVGELAQWAQAMPRPTAILVVSAHWEQRPTTIGATTAVPLVYDFYGFPEKYYQTTYRTPPSAALADRVRDLLRASSQPFADAPQRGLDHGAYIPLVAMYPQADIPVLQISMPVLDPEQLYKLGTALAPLRADGVLIFGSGFLTHNMRYAFRPGIPAWASEFDDWAKDAIARIDIDTLLQFQTRAPAARTALPTWEHYAPLLVSVGALGDTRPPVSFPITGWWMDSAFTKRSVQFG